MSVKVLDVTQTHWWKYMICWHVSKNSRCVDVCTKIWNNSRKSSYIDSR